MKKKYWNNSDLHKEHIEAGKVSRWQTQRSLVDRVLNEIVNLELEQRIALKNGKLD